MKDYTKEDKAQRARLEKQASVGERDDIVGRLNHVTFADAVFQRSAGDMLSSFRASAQGHRRTVNDLNARHDVMMAKAAVEAFNRMDPIKRAVASGFRAQPKQAPDTEGDDAAIDERYVSPLRASKVPGAEGSMNADAQTRREYEPRITVEGMRAIAIAKAWSSRYW